MAIIISDYEIYGVIIFWFFGKVIGRFGGLHVSYLRARKIPFFTYALKDAGKERHLHTKKISDLKHGSPTWFEDKDGAMRLWPEEDQEDYIDRLYGAPFLEWRSDDARPMPISKHDGILLDPTKLIKPFKDKSTTDLNRIGQKTPRIQTAGTLLMLLLLVAVISLLYYEFYYGQNIACAVHAKGVTCGLIYRGS